jgi:hypothetical protein
MDERREQRFIYAITWVNCGWQMVFGLAWGFGVNHLAEARWGSLTATLIQGGAILGPTLIVALIVFRWMGRIGIWR